MLDFPEFDPHGDPIPDKNGKLPEQKKAKSLSVMQPGSNVTVLKVNDFDSDFLKHISRIGIALNKKIEVKEVLKFDGSMLLAIDGKELNVSNKLAANIFVINSN
jgi:DtxR family Mn-dependent transcriptional regulator